MTPQNETIQPNVTASLKAVTEVLRRFYDLHPQDPIITAFNSAVTNNNSAEITQIAQQTFIRFPTNPIRANLLYKRLNTAAPDIAVKILDSYQSGQYADQIVQTLEEKAASIEAQMELYEAEIKAIQEKIIRKLEPEKAACEERISKLKKQIKQQRAIVKTIQDKVDAIAMRLITTKENLQDAIFEQTRINKKITSLSLEDDDDEDSDDEGNTGKSGDSRRLKQQKSGQERIAALIKEEIAHLDINQKAVTRELNNAKAQLATLEDMLSSEMTARDDIAADIQAQKDRIANIEAQSADNASEIAKLEIDKEFVQSEVFKTTFNALSRDIPMSDGQEKKLTKFIEENAQSQTLLSAVDDSDIESISIQEQQNTTETEQNTTTQEDELNLDRDLAMEIAVNNAIRMAMTMENGGMVPEADFDALMDSLPSDLRKKVEPAVEERLVQKGITIDQDNGFTMISDAKPQIFDSASRGPKSHINSANPANPKARQLRQAFVESEAFKKYNAKGVEASYDTKPIRGIDPNIFQKGLNTTNFSPAQHNQGPALDNSQPKPKQNPGTKYEIKKKKPGQTN